MSFEAVKYQGMTIVRMSGMFILPRENVWNRKGRILWQKTEVKKYKGLGAKRYAYKNGQEVRIQNINNKLIPGSCREVRI